MDSRNLIDVTEAQRLCGLDKSTIYRLIRKGHLRSFSVLSAVRLDRDDVLALATERPQRYSA
jgi:excisionase family DNA binding protein